MFILVVRVKTTSSNQGSGDKNWHGLLLYQFRMEVRSDSVPSNVGLSFSETHIIRLLQMDKCDRNDFKELMFNLCLGVLSSWASGSNGWVWQSYDIYCSIYLLFY